MGAALLVGCVVLGACASEAEQPRLLGSRTPRVTVGETPAELEALLLSASDVRDIDGFEGAEASDLDDLELYENPDPRGPCGRPMDALPTPDGGRVFSTEDGTFVELVWADGQEIEGMIGDFDADLRPGCGSHESTTNQGLTQEASEPVPIDTTGIGDRAIGWTATLRVSGQTAGAGMVVAVEGGRAVLVQQIAPEVEGEQLADLARAAAERAGG
jgi:hypothetical protein